MAVWEYLGRGAESAKPGRELCDLLGVNLRELTGSIEAERRQGHPICASTTGPNKGYYLARNMEEMQAYCKSLAHRAGEIERTLQACEKAGAALPQQTA